MVWSRSRGARYEARRWPRGILVLASLCHLFGAVSALAGAESRVAAADAAFADRAAGARGSRAAAEPVGAAIRGYAAALRDEPESLAVRSKLLRALFFRAEYHLRDEDSRREELSRGRAVFDEGLDLLSAETGIDLRRRTAEEIRDLLGKRPEAGPFFFWGALHWGLWSQYFGRMASVRSGSARKIRHLAEVAVALDPRYENGGGYRLLGRLHRLTPRVPLITGWIRRDHAVEMLERANAVAPNDPLNRFFLAEALLEYRPDRRDEGRRLLLSAARMAARPDRIVEDLAAIEQARSLYADLD